MSDRSPAELAETVALTFLSDSHEAGAAALAELQARAQKHGRWWKQHHLLMQKEAMRVADSANARADSLRDTLLRVQGLSTPGSPLWEIATTALTVDSE